MPILTKRESTPERLRYQRDYARNRRAQSPEMIREIRRRAHLKHAYGMTPEQYAAMFQTQGCACAICKGTKPGSKKGWHIDHCHSTGKVRGILCNNCNLMIGQAGDNEQRLIDAVFYLLEHRN